MKFCLAQTAPIIGNVDANIKEHLAYIEAAAHDGASLVVFSELSLTGYEPRLAPSLAVDIGDDIFLALQAKADYSNITVAAGMPIRSKAGIHISMVILTPHAGRQVYHKRILHRDEIPYFSPGEGSPFIMVSDYKVALGICYETLQARHFEEAAVHQADLFVASVAKPDRSLDKGYIHWPAMAVKYALPIAMVNSVGPCDDFVSNGKSAIWDSNGILAAQLETSSPGSLVYNIDLLKPA